MASSLLTGERAVDLIYVAIILFHTNLSILYEALSLFLLSVFALFVEISVESSGPLSLFKTRPGASSGILLGTVTLPGLAVAMLIKSSRPDNNVGVEEFEWIQFLYWATSASCFGVLVFLCFICRPNPNKTKFWNIMLSISLSALNATTFYLSFATKFSSGWYTALNLFSIACHALAAGKFIQYALHAFPACASFGEALLVTAGLVVYSGDMFMRTVAKIGKHLLSSELKFVGFGVKRSELSTINQGIILGLLFSPILFKCAIQTWEICMGSSNCEVREHHPRGRAAIFYGSVAFILFVIAPSWMQYVQEFRVHPFRWVLEFVFSEPELYKRLLLCASWIAIICVAVCWFYKISKNSRIQRILLRKYYHLMAVIMFVPALVYQPLFLSLAFAAALAVFLVLETIRKWRIWPLGPLVHQFMNAFTDHRDSDLLIVSHFSLLLGCALPLWLTSESNDRPLAPFAGILSLGIGDTMASMVGYKYGVLRWSKTGKKTIVGTAAGITSVLAACFALLPLLALTGRILTQRWVSLLLPITISGLLEAYTTQLDNAFIPLVFYSLMLL